MDGWVDSFLLLHKLYFLGLHTSPDLLSDSLLAPFTRHHHDTSLKRPGLTAAVLFQKQLPTLLMEIICGSVGSFGVNFLERRTCGTERLPVDITPQQVHQREKLTNDTNMN